jgi:tRNA(fMet)-specific endonuclease VapC
MIVLDTDHLTVLKYVSSDRATRLQARLDGAAGEVVGTTVVNVEEQMRGWLATLARERQVRRHITPYGELARLFDFFREFHLALFDEAAADRFDHLARVRIGTMDKKIAAISLANDALLLTANRQDFEQVPGLRFENWLD